jgi:hypothetical protein
VLAEVAALTAEDAALRAANPVNLGDAAAATSITTAYPMTPPVMVPAAVSAAMPVASRAALVFAPPIATAMAKPSGRSGRARPDGAELALVAAPPRAARRTAKARPAPTAAVPPVQVAASRLVAQSFGYDSVTLDGGAWIIAARRDGLPSPVTQAAAHSPDIGSAVAGFDSDDPVLNAFAARMRSAVNDNRAPVFSPEVAISRLEALISRLRRA